MADHSGDANEMMPNVSTEMRELVRSLRHIAIALGAAQDKSVVRPGCAAAERALLEAIAELEARDTILYDRMVRLLQDCGFSTPALLRILDPLFALGPTDHGQEHAAKKHPQCVARMCGKIDCGSHPGPCYVYLRAPQPADSERSET